VPTWAERHPHPGDLPLHPGPYPDGGAFVVNLAARLNEWWLRQQAWNDYVRRERLHRIARAVDALVLKEGTPSYGRPNAGLDPHEEIALMVGLMHLDGSTVSVRVG